MPHPLDDPKAGDRWIFSHPRPDGSIFKRDFLLIHNPDNNKTLVVMDYLLWGPLDSFDFDASVWRDGKWKKVRNGR